MGCKSTPKNPIRNPNPKKITNVLHVGGIPVEFPYQPYGSQLAFMGRVISTLDRAQRDGRCHALLESPTGTGKTLSLLCSAIAWQQNHKSHKSMNISQSKPNPEALANPLACGGGFIPEMEPQGNLETVQSQSISKNHKKKMAPTIFYASRTHTQITQVIREYRKTTYRVPMAVLASRKHYCTNGDLRGKQDIDEQCKLLLKNQEVGCIQFKNVHKVKGHPSLQKGGCHEAHDIEDLVKVGQVVQGCSYFAARSMADDAQLVFCPYSYIINPVIRRAMEVDIRGAILILDEAHNIEDMARDAGSFDIEEDVLHQLQTELGQLRLVDSVTYQPLDEMVQDVISWIERRRGSLEKREFQHYFSCWTGDKALRELQEANISQQCFPILKECAAKAIKAASDAEPGTPHLNGMSATTLEGLFSSLNYFFSENGLHIFDFQLSLQRFVKRDGGDMAGSWVNTWSLWCLNPAVVFRDIAHLSLSVILTSGTLSPMSSFSSELGVQFGTSLEAPHVIDVDSQLWAAVIPSGPGNYPLNASYKMADGYAFQDEVGTSLEEIFKIVSGGCLVFFPSYKLMGKLHNRWRETGQLSRLNAQKTLFLEPKGGSQDDFEPILKNYYSAIHGSNKHVPRRKRRCKISDLDNHDGTESMTNSKKGAAFFAVCRGKVSEGIDFSDENARAVIIVGIPFPNMYNVQVAQKKKFNDTYKSSKNLLSGNEWYCHQAFRALNQAAGRCIRHRFDYGAIILLDQRFCEERNVSYVSKWLRKSIRQYDSFEKSLEGLSFFFGDVKQRVAQAAKVVPNSDIIDVEDGPSTDWNQKVHNSNPYGHETKLDSIPAEKDARLGPLTFGAKNEYYPTPTKSYIQASRQTNDADNSSCRNFIDLECHNDKDSGYSSVPPMALSPDDTKSYIVKETPGLDASIAAATSESWVNDESSCSTMFQPFNELSDRFILCDPTLTPKSTHTSMITPERNVSANRNCLITEQESSLNFSVNSHNQKRKKSLDSRFLEHLKQDKLDIHDDQTPVHHTPVGSSMKSEVDCKMEFGYKSNTAEHECKISDVLQLLASSNSDASCVSSSLTMDNRRQIFCSLCGMPLGLPENNLNVACLPTSSSKIHLVSLHKGTSEPLAMNSSISVPVLVTDRSSVDQRLFNKTADSGPGQGIWCKEDGCVFNTVFCPFCSNSSNCLGVQVMATDASNLHLLNKILFYSDKLEIKNLEASMDKGLSPSSSVSCHGKGTVMNFIEKFSYSPHQNSGGWRTTKSKMRLPRKGCFPHEG